MLFGYVVKVQSFVLPVRLADGNGSMERLVGRVYTVIWNRCNQTGLKTNYARRSPREIDRLGGTANVCPNATFIIHKPNILAPAPRPIYSDDEPGTEISNWRAGGS